MNAKARGQIASGVVGCWQRRIFGVEQGAEWLDRVFDSTLLCQ